MWDSFYCLCWPASCWLWSLGVRDSQALSASSTGPYCQGPQDHEVSVGTRLSLCPVAGDFTEITKVVGLPALHFIWVWLSCENNCQVFAGGLSHGVSPHHSIIQVGGLLRCPDNTQTLSTKLNTSLTSDYCLTLKNSHAWHLSRLTALPFSWQMSPGLRPIVWSTDR